MQFFTTSHHLQYGPATNSKEYNKILRECQLFGKEAEFFVKYLPIAKRYCDGMGKSEFLDIYPKCYYGDDNLFVFEDLSKRGFGTLNKKELHDFETARVSVKTLAMHHAISHAVVADYGGTKKFFEAFPKLKFEVFEQSSWRKMLEPSFVRVMETNIGLLETCGLKGAQETANKMREMKGKEYDELLILGKTEDDDLFVLNHGDYWNNNLMFEKDKICSPIVNDFQLCRYASPCVDLSYYLFTTVKLEVRKNKLVELFQAYLDTLNEVVSALGHPINYKLDQLLKEFSKYFYFGFWIGFCFYTAPDTGVNLDIKEGQSMEEYFKEVDELERKWILENPEKCLESAKRLMQFIEEYEALKGGTFYHGVK